MKVIYSIPVLFLALLLTNCGSKEVTYAIAEDKFVFERDSLPYGEQKMLQESFASFLTYEFKEGSDPLKIYVSVNEIMPNVNNIKDVNLQLDYKNEKGEIKSFLPDELKEFKVEYSNGRAILSLPIENRNIASQINWQEADWGEYTRNNYVNLIGTFIFRQKEFPPNMTLKFKITWKDREKQFETTLTKGDYVGPKINPKF